MAKAGRGRTQDDYLFFYGLHRVTVDDLPKMLPWRRCRLVDKRTERRLGTMTVEELMRKFG